MLKTIKRTFVGTIVVAVAAYALFYIVPKVASKVKEDESNVEVIVTFDPPVRTGNPIRKGGDLTDVVTIIVSMSSTTGGAAHVTPDKAKESPWERFYYLAPGQKMIVSADQFVGTKIGCEIKYRNHGGGVKREAPGPGGVSCVFVAGK